MSTIKLPAKQLNPEISLDQVLEKRGSCRYFNQEKQTLQELSNLLWASQGITDKRYRVRRTVASAGAVYPIKMFIAVRKNGMHNLDQGIYYYNVEDHSLEQISDEDITKDLSKACYNQEFINKASFTIILSSDNSRTKELYNERGDQYVFMEAGSITQNIYLAAVERKLGTVFIGAFDDQQVKEIVGLDKLRPLAVMPVGTPSDNNYYT